MKNDGGPAFPDVRQDMDGDHMGPVYSAGGMTLRDYFATAALVLIENASDRHAVARVVYGVADAMLAERAK